MTRWRTADGVEVPANTPGARPVTEQSRTWYGWVDGQLVALNTDDEGQAWVALRRLLREQNDRDAGIRAPVAREAVRTVDEYVDDWAAYLAAKGTSALQCQIAPARVRRVVASAGWRWPADLREDSFIVALAAAARERDWSARTRNHCRTHTIAFAAWLSKRLAIANPLDGAGVPLPDDPQHVHRCPTVEELALLFAHLDDPAAPTRCGMTAACRAVGYRVALGTGLRADELRSLTRRSFRLDGPRPTVVIRAAYAKARREDTQPIAPDLAQRLTKYFAADGNCWERFPHYHPGRPLRDDLLRAGVVYKTDEGFLDFHALRVFYITELCRNPANSLKTVMSLARHQSARLTLRIYARVRGDDLDAAVGGLPTF